MRPTDWETALPAAMSDVVRCAVAEDPEGIREAVVRGRKYDSHDPVWPDLAKLVKPDVIDWPAVRHKVRRFPTD